MSSGRERARANRRHRLRQSGDQPHPLVSRLSAAEIVLVAEADAGGAKGVADFRRILDDATIDAVTIATPDHWHTPVALLALEAGKRVYAAHFANIAVRVGRTIHFDPAQERIVDDDTANSLLVRKYRQGGYWGIPNGV